MRDIKYKDTDVVENCQKTDNMWVKVGTSEKSGKLFTVLERGIFCRFYVYTLRRQQWCGGQSHLVPAFWLEFALVLYSNALLVSSHSEEATCVWLPVLPVQCVPCDNWDRLQTPPTPGDGWLYAQNFVEHRATPS